MCDTLVSTPRSSTDGLMILGKNSDRETNEAQNVTFVPARNHPSKSRVRCTHIDIPQAAHTHAALLSRPFWMFGAEMGVNEHGVAIGNEAVFTKEKYHTKNNALTGMDMLRLALERSGTALEARDVIIDLLGRYGQGGEHAMGGTKYYHNSFLIADPSEAFILETAGRHWVSKQVFDVSSISNCLTIHDDYDETSPGLEDYARARGYVKLGRVMSFQRDFSDSMYTHFARGRVRKSCSYGLLSRMKGKITSREMMRILRDHNTQEPYRPGEKPMERICLHAGGLISSQSTGSMVAVLKKGLPPLVYLTGTSAPCMSLYKPHAVFRKQDSVENGDCASPSVWGGVDMYGSSARSFNDTTLWWTGEQIHRRVLMNYAELMPEIRGGRDAAEKKAVRDVELIWKSNNLKEFQHACRKGADALVKKNYLMAETVKSAYERSGGRTNVPWWFAAQWRRINRRSGLEI